MKSLRNIPRTKIGDYMGFEVGAGLPVWGVKDLEVGCGDGEDGLPLYGTINGKVLGFVYEADHEHYQFFKRNLRVQGGEFRSFEVLYNLNIYEPIYGEPKKSVEEFGDDQKCYIEDLIVRGFQYWKIVAVFKP